MPIIICATQPERRVTDNKCLQIWVEYLIMSLPGRNILTWEDHIDIQDVSMNFIPTLFNSQYPVCSLKKKHDCQQMYKNVV
jgi:hypothetical protein